MQRERHIRTLKKMSKAGTHFLRAIEGGVNQINQGIKRN